MKERKIIVKIYRKCLMKSKKYKITIFLDRSITSNRGLWELL